MGSRQSVMVVCLVGEITAKLRARWYNTVKNKPRISMEGNSSPLSNLILQYFCILSEFMQRETGTVDPNNSTGPECVLVTVTNSDLRPPNSKPHLSWKFAGVATCTPH